MPRKPGISFQYGNNLLVSRHKLQAAVFPTVEKFRAVSPEELHSILSLGHQAISDQIEAMYEQVHANNPEAVRPSMWTVMMAPDHYRRRATISPHAVQSIITRALDIRPNFRPYWHAIEDAGFMPKSHRGNGRWILLRKPESKN